MSDKQKMTLHSSILLLAIVIISLLHYLTPVMQHHLHAIYQRLYYIPVILAAWKMGLWRGIPFALLAGILYAPHIVIQWGHHQHEVFTQLIEVAMIFVVGVVTGVLSDRQRREQEALRKAELQVAHMDRLALLGQLAAGLAHEIRNPLGSLIGSAEILEKEVPKDNKAAPFVPIMKKELSRIKEKLNTFLTFAKPNTLNAIPNDLNAMVHSTTSLIAKEAAGSGVVIKVDADETLPLYSMDCELLRQVLLNLLLNGIQAMESGGELVIETFGTEHEFGFRVTDQGEGIDPETAHRLFEPFFTTKAEGTGLGLAIVQKQVSAMNGTIALVPSKRGASFEVRIAI